MKKLFLNLFITALFLWIGYGFLLLIGWFMDLNIPVPILIIGFCILLYITIRKEVIK